MFSLRFMSQEPKQSSMHRLMNWLMRRGRGVASRERNKEGRDKEELER